MLAVTPSYMAFYCAESSVIVVLTHANLKCRYWSDAKIWQELPPRLLEAARLDKVTGLPGYGSNLTIPSSWALQLDTDTAELWHLELQGALTFSEESATSLTTHTLAMPLGSMSAGNATHPHPAPVRR